MAKRKGSSTPTPSSPEKRTNPAGARSRTRERREERDRQRRRQQQITLVVGLVVVAVVVVALIFLTSQPAEAPIPETAMTQYDQVTTSKTDDGFFVLGDPDAGVKVVEYASFDCPHCGEFHEQIFPSLFDRVVAGDISFTYIPLYGTGGIPNGEGAARAAICAGEQGEFWSFHDALFSWQGIYGQQAFSQNRISAGIDNLGINRSQFDSCLGSSTPGTVIDAATQSAVALGSEFTGTPAIFVNGVSVAQTLSDINNQIDAALAALPPRTPTVVPTEEATSEATEEATVEATEMAAPTEEATKMPAAEDTPEATAES